MSQITILKRVEALLPACAEAQAVLASLLRRTKDFAANETLVEEGAVPACIHILLSGWAARFNFLCNGARQISGFLLPGDVCEHQSLVLARLDHSITALTPVTVAEIRREDLLDAVDRHPDLAKAFWLVALLEQAILREWLVNVGRRNAEARIAHLLLELYSRARLVGLATDHDCELPLAQAEIADSQGLTAVHVNRVLQGLRSDGLVDLHRQRLTVRDLDGLRRKSEFDPDYLRLPAAA